MFRLDGKTAVITGGGSGIGRAIAELFAARGARVHILDFDPEAGRQVTASICQNGGACESTACDVSVQEDVRGAFDSILAQRPVDILVNNAGIAHVGNLEATSEEDLDRILRVNVKGVYNCLLACVPHMKQRRQGVILNMASIAGSCGIADRFAYSTSKGAVLAMTYSVAKDYLAHGIRCNCISPARVFTPFVEGYLKKNYPGREEEIRETLARSQPIGRMAEPAEVAALALYLCSDQASFITGADYPLDGGFCNLR